MEIYLRRTISSSHVLSNPLKTEEWNKEMFGKCYESIHGHNFGIVLRLEGEVDPETGMVVNFNVVKSVIDRYDHKHLNNILPLAIPTAETLCTVILSDLKKELELRDALWKRMVIKVWETENAYASLTLVNEGVEL